MSREKNRKILDEVRDVLRRKRYSIHTERIYVLWIKKFIHFHQMTSRDDFVGGETKIEEFLTHLAVTENVAPATQNQGMNALVFLYRKVPECDLDEKINAVRAAKKKNIPVVMTKDETAAVISQMQGKPLLVVKLLYGSGLRISEALRLRVHDIDFHMK